MRAQGAESSNVADSPALNTAPRYISARTPDQGIDTRPPGLDAQSKSQEIITVGSEFSAGSTAKVAFAKVMLWLPLLSTFHRTVGAVDSSRAHEPRETLDVSSVPTGPEQRFGRVAGADSGHPGDNTEYRKAA
jgi:hypothetical protein